jgi:PDZ domain-containing secreted protein
MTRIPRNFLLALVLLGAAPINQVSADSIVKVRLTSADTMIDVEGTATLQGQNLSGHLSGDGIDVTLTGLIKNDPVSVEVVGRIVPSCSLNRQSMNGIGINNNEATSIDMTFQCSSKAGNFGGGEDYQFRLNLALPSRPLYSPSPTNSGESASVD